MSTLYSAHVFRNGITTTTLFRKKKFKGWFHLWITNFGHFFCHLGEDSCFRNLTDKRLRIFVTKVSSTWPCLTSSVSAVRCMKSSRVTMTYSMVCFHGLSAVNADTCIVFGSHNMHDTVVQFPVAVSINQINSVGKSTRRDQWRTLVNTWQTSRRPWKAMKPDLAAVRLTTSALVGERLLQCRAAVTTPVASSVQWQCVRQFTLLALKIHPIFVNSHCFVSLTSKSEFYFKRKT
jgi:hypothetical protein